MKHWRLVYLEIPLMILVFLGIMCVNGQKSPELCAGVGRETQVYMASGCADEAQTAERELDHYTEGQGEAPVWWDPEEDMAVEWVASYKQVKESNNEAGSDENVITKLATQQVNSLQSDYNAIQRTDAGCPDYNIETTIYGWDGHCMEAWEMDLFSMIFYKEFWGTSIPCCEAGCDAMLNLWSSGLYGRTMGEVLSAVNDSGYYIFSTYPSVLETDYDPDGLEWCKEFCFDRFLNGPTWVDAMYFRLYGYHDTSWSIPLYEIDGVYFSAGK